MITLFVIERRLESFLRGPVIVRFHRYYMRARHGRSNLRIFRDGFRILKMIIEELANGPLIEKRHH